MYKYDFSILLRGIYPTTPIHPQSHQKKIYNLSLTTFLDKSIREWKIVRYNHKVFLIDTSCNEETWSIYRLCSACLAFLETCQTKKINKWRNHLLVLNFNKQVSGLEDLPNKKSKQVMEILLVSEFKKPLPFTTRHLIPPLTITCEV